MSYVMTKRGVGICWFYKRHYEALAAVMQETKPDALNHSQAAIEWAFVCTKLADMLARDNASFKRELFLRACEPGANVRARS
jgi:hypothetical protein